MILSMPVGLLLKAVQATIQFTAAAVEMSSNMQTMTAMILFLILGELQLQAKVQFKLRKERLIKLVQAAMM